MLEEIRRRLKPGAPFVLAHMSFPQALEEHALWLSRYAASANGSRLPLLGPDDEEALLTRAGFTGTRLFYAGFVFRGWVTYA